MFIYVFVKKKTVAIFVSLVYQDNDPYKGACLCVEMKLI